VAAWIESAGLRSEDYLFPSRVHVSPHIGTRQYARILDSWVAEIGLDTSAYGTHSMRRTKASLIYRRTKNLRAVQLLLGHTRLDYLPRRTMSRFRGTASAEAVRNLPRWT
jgi:site-specific recombinase XerD